MQGCRCLSNDIDRKKRIKMEERKQKEEKGYLVP